MDIEKLIEQLRTESLYADKASLEIMDLCMEAATALSTLQDENESLKEKLYDGEGVNLVDYWMQQAKIEENGHRNCQAENEKLRAELEQTRENNKKLIAAMMMIQKSENQERMHVVYKMDYSAAIDHQTARDIAVIVFDGLMREDLRLRGQKED